MSHAARTRCGSCLGRPMLPVAPSRRARFAILSAALNVLAGIPMSSASFDPRDMSLGKHWPAAKSCSSNTKAPGKSRFDVKLTDPSGRILTLTRSSDFNYLVQRLFGAFSSGDSAGSDRSDGIEMTDKFNR